MFIGCHSRRRTHCGVTLTEVLVASLLSLLIFAVVPPFYLMSVNLWKRGNVELSARHNASWVVQRMKEDARNAIEVTVVSPTAVVLEHPLRELEDDGRSHNVLGSESKLSPGDRVTYYLSDEMGALNAGGTILWRQVTLAGGKTQPPTRIATGIYPHLNPFAEGTDNPADLFDFDEDTLVLTVTVTVVHRSPGSSFGPREFDASSLERVSTDGHPQGVVVADGGGTLPTGLELATAQGQFLVRNSEIED